MKENIDYTREWIPQWAMEAGLSVEKIGDQQLQLCDQRCDIHVQFECADVFHFIQQNKTPADVLIAHAFLDLLPLPESLTGLLSLTKGLAWLTLNFDGVSTLQPVIDRALDEKIERLYHETMDRRSTGGDSRTGRKLFEHFLPVRLSPPVERLSIVLVIEPLYLFIQSSVNDGLKRRHAVEVEKYKPSQCFSSVTVNQSNFLVMEANLKMRVQSTDRRELRFSG